MVVIYASTSLLRGRLNCAPNLFQLGGELFKSIDLRSANVRSVDSPFSALFANAIARLNSASVASHSLGMRRYASFGLLKGTTSISCITEIVLRGWSRRIRPRR